jgi:rubrerythrin
VNERKVKTKAMEVNIEELSLEDILGMAVKTEIQGRKFYLSLAEKVSHPEAKKKIQSLADDEKRHERVMVDLYRKTLKREPRDLPDKGIPDIVKAIAGMNISEKSQLLQVIDMAIEAELVSARFYKRGAVISEDSRTKRVFEQLEKEEDGHYNFLVAEKSALSGDPYWFSMGDSAMMEE